MVPLSMLPSSGVSSQWAIVGPEGDGVSGRWISRDLPGRRDEMNPSIDQEIDRCKYRIEIKV